MSLIGHWKLDGDATDSSGNGNHGTIVGTISYTNGKINECLSLDGSVSGVQLLPNSERVKYENLYSISLWVRPTGTSIETVAKIMSQDASDYFTIVIDQTTSTQELKLYRPTITGIAYLELDTWYHMLVTIDLVNSIMNFYLDDELVATGNPVTLTGARPLVLGGNTELDGDISGNHFIGDIDDVRVYDHLLSTKEIHELSMAKILHYDFNMFSEPTTNIMQDPLLLDYLNNYTMFMYTSGDWNNYWEVREVDGYPCIHVHWERISTVNGDSNWNNLRNNTIWTVPNTPYTLTCKVKINDQVGNSSQIRLARVANDYWTSGHPTWNFSGYSTGVWHDVELIDLDPQPTYYKDPTTYDLAGNFTMYSGNMDTVGYYVDYDICFMQVENKDHSTPFVDGSRTGQVLDNSGNDNYSLDLVEATTPEWTPDSLLGSGAYSFDGINDYVELSKPLTIFNSSFTVSMWCYFLDDSRGILLGDFQRQNAVDINFEKTVDRKLRLYWTGALDIYSPVNSIDLNQWQHIVFVRDKINDEVRMYVDTQLVYTYYGALSDVSTTSLHLLGRDNRTGITTLYGYIDDVRIYATALSAEDIYEIANVRASIDNEGILWAK